MVFIKIGEFIQSHMNQKNMSQAELARRTGVPASTISSIINRNNDRVAIEMILKICEVLECDIEEYINPLRNEQSKSTDSKEIISMEEQVVIKKYRELDTHGKKIVDLVLDEEYERCTYVEEEDTITLPFSLLKASAGLGDYLFDENFEEIEVEDTPLANQSDFVIEVDGDSMLPKFQNGDKVFVKGQQNIDVGDIGIFIIDGCGYIKQAGNGELISLNSEYPNIELHDYNDVKCIGKVIGKVE